MTEILQMPYDVAVRIALASLERNLLPDAVIRRFIRLLIANRLRSGYKPSSQLQLSDLLHFVLSLREMPIAIKTDRPNAQHYELPTSFFKLILGKHLKYSCCYFNDKSSTLEDAEEAMLQMYCDRSQVKDGHTVLDVGCGWGSLLLYIAQNYKSCRLTGICNSTSQKHYIEEHCRDLQLYNVDIIVADINTFEMEIHYDRIFSVEMFEHMKNYKDLLKKISGWMKRDSLLFVHHFCHKVFAYHLEVITAICFPYLDCLGPKDDVAVVDHWLLNGKHGARTSPEIYALTHHVCSEEWLKRMDNNIASIKPILETTYGKDSAIKWTVYWRTFFIAVAELFGYNDGEEWMVSHFLFKKK
ncbi:unnamed protein product [Citrullus colocynthis]|uniref:(S)-coclaurine N-methyltransferase-like n=1 Tax=Citrullus colocynthis TaxID=252529 RepID=A0ABP0YCN7_9ROSI